MLPFALFFERAPIALAALGPDGQILETNSLFDVLFGLTRGGFRGMCFYDLGTPGAGTLRSDLETRLFGNGYMAEQDHILTGAGGRRFSGRLAGIAVETDGVRVGFLGVTDVTLDLAARAAHRERDENDSLLLDNISEGASLNQLVFDAGGEVSDYRILKVNKAFYSVADVSSNKVEGSLATEVYGMEPEMIRDFWLKHRSDPGPDTGEFLSPLNNRWFTITTSPYFGNKFVTTFVDITDRKKFQEVSQRVERLESLGNLAGGIAHDLNNLLGALFANLELVSQNPAGEKSGQYLDKARNLIGRARSLTAQYLTFAKGGAPHREPGALVPLAAATVRTVLEGTELRFLESSSGEFPLCSFDRDQLTHVFSNLAQNTWEVLGGRGTLELTAALTSVQPGQHPKLSPGDYLRVTLKDDGPGIPGEILPRIFEPFFFSKALGSGLGLASSHSIVERHGGWLDVDSVLGRGTSFHIFLPVLPDGPAPGRETLPQTGTVVVMDDDGPVREAFAEILGTLGYTVLTARDGAEAVDLVLGCYREGRPLAVLLFDLTVPGGMGGTEALAAVHRVLPGIPAVAVSGYSDDPVMSDPEAYGFSAALAKPFSLRDLTRLLRGA